LKKNNYSDTQFCVFWIRNQVGNKMLSMVKCSLLSIWNGSGRNLILL